MHKRLDGVGRLRPGELIAFGLAAFYYRDAKIFFAEIRVYVKHTLGLGYRLLRGGVYCVSLLPQEFPCA